jgi:hypothetical protein
MQDFNFDVSYMLIAFHCETHSDFEIVYMEVHLDESPSISLLFKL